MSVSMAWEHPWSKKSNQLPTQAVPYLILKSDMPKLRKMLAVVYGLKKFHHYTHGRKVNVFTDHKLLVSICQKPLAKAPKQLQNLLLRAQQYDFSIKYKPGKEIPLADALLRAPTDKPEAEELMIMSNLTRHPIKDRRPSEIRSKTLEDPIMKILAEVIATGWLSDKRLLPDSLKPFFDYRDELTAQDELILRGQRIVIPLTMRSEMKQKSQVSHLGINSCLRRERTDILARHVCWNTAICTSLRHLCNICRSSTSRAFHNHRSTKKTLATSCCRHFLMGRKWISSYSGSAQQFF